MATILVVDDEMGIRELLSEILSDEGHVVEAAENAQAAREYRLNQAPDLVLLDIWMPDTDGVTLLKEWAAQGLLTMPVIMMSGHATIDTAVEATKIGALDFLEKPIALQKLLKSVEHGLARGAAPVSANAAAKAGVMALTRCAALEASPYGVRINAVAPSIAMHDFLKKSAPADLLNQLASREAFGRAAEVWEVANVMVFLASDYASYMTGEVLSVSSQHA